jgi:NAD+ kinase
MEVEEIKNFSFSKPFIIYRIESEKAIIYARKISKYLLSNFPKITEIYIEKPNEINSDNVFETEVEKTKYKNNFIKFEAKTEKSDLCIVIGGDGTCLWANNCYKYRKNKPPFITFHLGNLGYLAIYDIENYQDTLNELISNNFIFEKRNLISATLIDKNNQIKESYTALNEVLIQRGSDLKMISLEIYIDKVHFTEVSCDGIIFATPTGSSAYSLSARGPLLHYKVEGLIITAICPFSLSFRPIVLPKNAVLEICIGRHHCEPCVSVDGEEGNKLLDGEKLKIVMGDEKLMFVILNKFAKDRNHLWKDKIIKSLGWNNSFKI